MTAYTLGDVLPGICIGVCVCVCLCIMYNIRVRIIRTYKHRNVHGHIYAQTHTYTYTDYLLMYMPTYTHNIHVPMIVDTLVLRAVPSVHIHSVPFVQQS